MSRETVTRRTCALSKREKSRAVTHVLSLETVKRRRCTLNKREKHVLCVTHVVSLESLSAATNTSPLALTTCRQLSGNFRHLLRERPGSSGCEIGSRGEGQKTRPVVGVILLPRKGRVTDVDTKTNAGLRIWTYKSATVQHLVHERARKNASQQQRT